MSAQPPATSSSNAAPQQTQPTTPAQPQMLIPAPIVLVQAAKLAIKEDKPILLDYYADSLNQKAFLVTIKETKEKVLLKSKVEYTSNITNTYKITTGQGDAFNAFDYLVTTQNSIYIISGKITQRAAPQNYLQDRDEE